MCRGFSRAARRLRASLRASWARANSPRYVSATSSRYGWRAIEWTHAAFPSRAHIRGRNLAGSDRRHYLPVSPSSERQPDNGCVVVSAGNFSSFGGVGHGGFVVHVAGSDAGVQLFVFAAAGEVDDCRSAELGGTVCVFGNVDCGEPAFFTDSQG